MKFTFGETVKLASKGYKPTDIAELLILDENKFSKDDILSLVSAGYTKSDIKKLVETFKDEDSSEGDSGDNSDAEDDQPNNTEKGSDGKNSDSDDSDDTTDYKSLYEKEKKLRESLQHSNASGDHHEEIRKETDEEVAQRIANSIY